MTGARELLEAAMVDEPELIEEITEVRGCAYVTHRGSRYVDPEPDEHCDNDAEPDEEFCSLHLDMGDDE